MNMDTLIINIYDSGYDISVVELNDGNGVLTHYTSLLQQEIDRAYHKFSDTQFKEHIDKHFGDKYRRIIIIDNCSVEILRGAKLL